MADEGSTQTRFVRDAEARLYEDLTWAGLHWDEGMLGCMRCVHEVTYILTRCSQVRIREGTSARINRYGQPSLMEDISLTLDSPNDSPSTGSTQTNCWRAAALSGASAPRRTSSSTSSRPRPAAPPRTTRGRARASRGPSPSGARRTVSRTRSGSCRRGRPSPRRTWCTAPTGKPSARTTSSS